MRSEVDGMATPIPEAGDPAGGTEQPDRIVARVAVERLSYPRLTVTGMDESQRNDIAPKGPERIASVRAKHPHAYEPWTEVDDARLVAGYRSGLGFEDLATRFGRQPSAIESRLKKIALEKLRAGSI
jgi:hypothetical protein